MLLFTVGFFFTYRCDEGSPHNEQEVKPATTPEDHDAIRERIGDYGFEGGDYF